MADRKSDSRQPTPPAGAPAEAVKGAHDLGEQVEEVTTATVAAQVTPDTGEAAAEGVLRGSSLRDVILQPGTAVGRYRVLGVLGAGGVGMVYAAHDPVLDRKVAVKVLRRSKSQHGVELGQRLMREAQVVAQISHPNIVSVFDVGVHEGQVYVAMELVEGQTVRQWLREPRSWRAVLGVYVAAGRGLAAAHAAGIIHRDFKPDNVLIGDDGRVRVLDFGIAAPASRDGDIESTGSSDDTPDADSLPGAWDDSRISTSSGFARSSSHLTSPGAILGTPAYMAPEQHLAQHIDARADQFCLCVALYEALFGQRPFHASARSRSAKLQMLCAAKLAGRVRPPPADSRVPGWLRRVVLRGLAGDRNDRWPSMNALLAQLTRDPARARRRWLAAGVLAVSVLASAGALVITLQQGAASARCGDAAAHLRGVWDDAVAARARAAMMDTGLAYAAGTWARTGPLLDDYARQWRAGYVDACEATHVHGSQSSALMDRRMACLHTRRDRLQTLSQLLVEADAAVIENASNAARALPRVSDCAELGLLVDTVEPPADPALRATVDGLREELAAATVLADAGREEQALARARATAERAAAIEYLPVRAEAWLRVGLLERRRGHAARAREALDRALWAAEASGHDEIAAPALVELVVLSTEEEMRSFMRRAEAAIHRSGKRELRAHLASVESSRCMSREDFACALERARRALDLWQQARGLDNVEAIRFINNLGVVYGRSGRSAEALASYRRALALGEELLGEEHPVVGFLHKNIGSNLSQLGQYEEAEAQARQALRIARSLGSSHRQLALCLHTLTQILLERGGGDEALALAQETLAMWQQLDFGESYRPLLAMARARAARGEWAVAIEHYRRALDLVEVERGLAHGAAAEVRRHLGAALRAQGDLDAARAELEAALVVIEAHSHPVASELAAVLDELGHVAAAEGRCAQALAHHTRALDARARSLGGMHPAQVDTLVSMARCHLQDARNDQATILLERALAIARALAASEHLYDGERLAEVERLLAQIRAETPR